jgi:enamine deaminase RidA (YjgF/YER057c/UK114 family)
MAAAPRGTPEGYPSRLTVGSTREKILSATIWLADIATFDEMNRVWDSWVPRGHAPARATVEARLAAPEFVVEIGIVAATS